MSRAIILDSGPLGVLSNPADTPATEEARLWLADLLETGHGFFIPDVSDYELRRELIRIKAALSIRMLDWLHEMFELIPIDSATLRRAAEIWADARTSGKPKTEANRLDADAIIAAQAELLQVPDKIFATTNVKDYEAFFDARYWLDIKP